VVWFSSREVQTVFEQEFKEPIGLSTVATYLARMAGKRLLSKAGPSNSLRYKAVTSVQQVGTKATDIVIKQ
jgi:predicted transcriptional regulator